MRPGSGFQVRMVEQGKQYLTSWERKFVPEPQSFRPAQWLIEYRWSSDVHCRPLRLSASICYDATDIALAADLKSKSDLYIVPALNPDVGTFDRMSEGLHYHMFRESLSPTTGTGAATSSCPTENHIIGKYYISTASRRRASLLSRSLRKSWSIETFQILVTPRATGKRRQRTGKRQDNHEVALEGTLGSRCRGDDCRHRGLQQAKFPYRAETFAILAINSWELLFKAKWLADNGNNERSLRLRVQNERAR